MIMHLYLAKRYLLAFLQVFCTLIIISYISTISEQIRYHSDHSLTFIQIMYLSLLLLPASLLLLLPFLIFMGSCFCFFVLARHGEFVAIRASGFSALKALIGPAIAVWVIALIATFIWQPFALISKEYYDDMRFHYMGIGQEANTATDGKIWLRQKKDDGVMFINIEKITGNNTLSGIKIFEYDAKGGAVRQINAKEAHIIDKNWILFDTKQWNLTAEHPEAEAQEKRTDIIETNVKIDVNNIHKDISNQTFLSFIELPNTIRTRAQKGLSTHIQELQLWTEMANIFLYLSMLIIGAIFMMQPNRLTQTSLMALQAFAFCFAIFFFNSSIHALGVSEKIPVIIAAFTGTLIAFMGALAFLLHYEDG